MRRFLCLLSPFHDYDRHFTALMSSMLTRSSLARRRVCDMHYLSPTRMWGPFQPVQRKGSDTRTSLDKYADNNYEDDGDDGNSDEEEDNDNLRLIYATNRKSQMNPPIAPYELVPDYVWLASARIIVEANLRDAFELSENPNTFSMGDVLPLLRRMHRIIRQRPKDCHWFKRSHPANLGRLQSPVYAFPFFRRD